MSVPTSMENGSHHEANSADFDTTVIKLLMQIAALLNEIAASSRRVHAKRLGRSDYVAVANLLPAIHGVLIDANFLTAELLAEAEDDEPLRRALDGALGPHVPGKSRSRRLGRLLARASGVNINGLVLLRLADTRDGAVWQVASGY